MEIKFLNENERLSAHAFYKNDDLFRHWSRCFSRLKKEDLGIDYLSAWHNSEVILRSLIDEEHKDTKLEFIISELINSFDNNIVVVIMFATAIRLLNAAEKGHEEDFIPNDIPTNVISVSFKENELFNKLAYIFFENKLGNDKQPVVIEPADHLSKDYYNARNNVNEDIDNIIAEVIQYTEKLKAITGFSIDDWKILWLKICADYELLSLLREIKPRNNEWGINQTMICNIVWMYLKIKDIKTTQTNVNNLLCEKNIKSYLSQYKDFNGTNSAFSRKEQFNKVKTLIKE